MKNVWVMGAFYTEGTAYEQVIKDYLLKSTEALGIRTMIKSIPNYGNWYRNVAEKPRVVLNMLEELPPEQCLVFVDADAIVVKYPKLFDEIPHQYDIARHQLNWNDHYGYKNDPPTLECLSGTLFFRNNTRVKDMCVEWHSKAVQSSEWEQKILGDCLKASNLKIFDLPYDYITIPSMPDGRPHPRGVTNAYITHGQVSRIYKRRLT